MKFPDSLFHYTIGPKLPLIAASGKLMPKGFGPATDRREKPVLWWSSASKWEHTATKVISTDGLSFRRPTFDELHSLFGAFRFKLQTRNPGALNAMGLKLLHWSRIPLVARIAPKDVAHMNKAGLALGAVPMNWWGCLEPVSVLLTGSNQLCLERFSGTQWEPLEGGLAEGVRLAEMSTLKIFHARASNTPAAQGL